MGQLNIRLTPDFDRKLARLMELRGISTKTEAVRAAVSEAVERAEHRPTTSWEKLRGAANKYEQRPREQWLTEDDLWGDR